MAGLAHGVKNLLMGIDGGMYMLESGIEKGDADRLVGGWEMLKEDMARMTSFVKEFLEFANDGVGMDYEIRKKIFSSFFSTKATGKGTGLGLLTTRKIVQEHGGSVSFDSTEGAGSVFRLEFPRDRLPRPTEDVEGEDS